MNPTNQVIINLVVSGAGPLARPPIDHERGATLTRAVVATVALFSLGACAAPTIRTSDQSQAAVGQVPAQVLALAGPYQDLQTVWLNPEDGCYWYRHGGQVETTMLPLRTGAGKVICLQNSDAPSAAG